MVWGNKWGILKNIPYLIEKRGERVSGFEKNHGVGGPDNAAGGNKIVKMSNFRRLFEKKVEGRRAR